MNIWNSWYKAAAQLRGAFTRETTFLWALTILAGFSTRAELNGVTSFIRALDLNPALYQSLIDFFSSSAVSLSKLTQHYCVLCLKLFKKNLILIAGKPVIVVDGIKVPKEGQRMPGVKLTHQESNNNSKPEFIMGHVCQVFCLLIQAAGVVLAIPLAGRIHEGLKNSPNDKKTIFDKLIV